MRRIRLWAIMFVPFAVFAGACGSSSKGSAPTPTSSTLSRPAATGAAGPAITIESRGSVFMFVTVPVKAGARVTVKNTTAVQHTVSANTTAGAFDLTVDPGTTMTFNAPSKPGTYKFHCNIHTYMTGTLTVT